MSPALNGSSVIRCFEYRGAIRICDGIIFDFYTGLPHILIFKHYQPLPSLCMILKAIHTETGLGLACETTNLQNSVGLVMHFYKAMCSPIKLKVNC